MEYKTYSILPFEEQPGGVFIMQFYFEMPSKNFPHHPGFAPPQHAVIDKDTSKLGANGAVEERCCDA